MPAINEYASVSAAIGDGKVAGDVFTVNKRLLYLRPGADFDAGSDDIAVPYEMRDAEVASYYEGGVAYDASPNSDWNWDQTETDTGTVTEAGDETTFTDNDANDQAYITQVPALGSHHLWAFISVKCTVGTFDDACRCDIDDETQIIALTFSSGAAGDVEFDVPNVPLDYSMGAASFTELCWEWHPDDSAIEVRLYDTQVVIGTATIADFGASGGAPEVKIGCASTANSGTMLIKGAPAFLLLDKRDLAWYDTADDASADNPADGDQAYIGPNKRLCTFVEGATFETGGITGADGIWVPSDYYAGLTVDSVYHAGKEYNAAPNSTWGYGKTTSGSATITLTDVVNFVTTFLASASEDAYLTDAIVGTGATDPCLMFIRCQATNGDVNDQANSFLWYTRNGGKRLRPTPTYDGVEQRVAFSYGTDTYTDYAAATYVEMLLVYDPNGTTATIYDHQTMEVLATRANASLVASATSGFYGGIWNSAGAKEIILKGYPAIALMHCT